MAACGEPGEDAAREPTAAPQRQKRQRHGQAVVAGEGDDAIGDGGGAHDGRPGRYLLYVESLAEGSPDVEMLERVVVGDESDPRVIDAVVERIRTSEALDRAVDIANEYVADAVERLEVVRDPDVRSRLRELLDLTISRSA